MTTRPGTSEQPAPSLSMSMKMLAIVACGGALGAVLRERDADTAAWIRELDARVPDRVIANPAASSMLFPFEYNFSFTRTLEYLASPERRRAGEIRLYRDAP